MTRALLPMARSFWLNANAGMPEGFLIKTTRAKCLTVEIVGHASKITVLLKITKFLFIRGQMGNGVQYVVGAAQSKPTLAKIMQDRAALLIGNVRHVLHRPRAFQTISRLATKDGYLTNTANRLKAVALSGVYHLKKCFSHTMAYAP